MTLIRKSRVVSASGGGRVRAEVRPARTCGALGTSSNRDAGATVSRNRFAGRRVALLLGAALAAVAGCDHRVSGDGVYTERTVAVSPFAGIWAQDDIDAVVTVSSTATPRVTLTGDQNIVEDNIAYAVEPETVGSTAIGVLHVRATRRFNAVIPARVVITVPDLALARASGGVDVQVTGAASGALYVVLEGATLAARDYVVDGAVVDLDAGARAVIHANGPVTGTVSADSRLDNSAGIGACAVATSGTGNVLCPP